MDSRSEGNAQGASGVPGGESLGGGYGRTFHTSAFFGK